MSQHVRKIFVLFNKQCRAWNIVIVIKHQHFDQKMGQKNFRNLNPGFKATFEKSHKKDNAQKHPRGEVFLMTFFKSGIEA